MKKIVTISLKIVFLFFSFLFLLLFLIPRGEKYVFSI